MIELGLFKSLQISKGSLIIGGASKRGGGSIAIHFNLFIFSFLLRIPF